MREKGDLLMLTVAPISILLAAALLSHSGLANDLLISTENSKTSSTTISLLSNPQPGLEEKFLKWSKSFTQRLTAKQNVHDTKLIALATDFSEPSESRIRYSIGITMSLPQTNQIDSGRIYQHLMLQSSGIFIEDLNKSLPILKVFSSGLQLSFDLSDPFGSLSEPQKPELHYSLAVNPSDGKTHLVPNLIYPQTTPSTIESKTSSMMPAWKFRGNLKPTFGAGPGINFSIHEVTGIYQFEKSLGSGKSLTQKISIPIPGSRITTTFKGVKAELTENNPVDLGFGRSAKFQFFYQTASLKLILEKALVRSKIELSSTIGVRSGRLDSMVLAYNNQI